MKIRFRIKNYLLYRRISKKLKLVVLRPRRIWWLMKIAKRTGGWDIWLGKKFGMDYDDDVCGPEAHWHLNRPPYVVYRKEY